jgi:hypothetical protein
VALKLRELCYALGAEVCGVDVGHALSEARLGERRQGMSWRSSKVNLRVAPPGDWR